MEHFDLQHALQRLRETVAEHPDMDAETRNDLTQLEHDIQRQLGATSADDTDNALVERAQELSAGLAVRHPLVEPVMRELINMLGRMGI